MDYYIADETWEVFGIKSREDYIEKNVIPGNFLSEVPEDIIKSFKTLTQLTAQAYYYYPLYDEALNKALRIFELAIKLKAKQLDLKEDSLNNLINKLCKIQNLKHLKETLHRARGIRNTHMHPENHSSGWFMARGKGNIQMFVNFINEIFQEDADLNYLECEREKLENFQNLSTNPLAIKEEDNYIFADELSEFRVFPANEEIKLALLPKVYTSNIDKQLEAMSAKPFIILFKEYELAKDHLKGITVENKELNLYYSKENIGFYLKNEWKMKIENSSRKDFKEHLFANMRNDFIWQCEEMIYKNCWDSTAEIT